MDNEAIEAMARAIEGTGLLEGDEAMSAARAVCEHLAATGQAIVPVEVSEAMVKAGVRLAMRIRLSPEYSWREYMADLHRAMIAAAQGEAK